MKGTLYILPNLIAETGIEFALPAHNLMITSQLKVFIAENKKNARLYLKNCGISAPYDHLTFYELNKRTSNKELNEMLSHLLSGNNTGLISDAGMPAIADPGADLVKVAHLNNIQVVPLAGPSSIILALAASGLNGQNFCFHGYLPISGNERIKALKDLEFQSKKSGYSQVFIETPYRNLKLLNDIFKYCHSGSFLCIAAGIMGKNQFIKTMYIYEWKNVTVNIHKIPTVFILNAR